MLRIRDAQIAALDEARRREFQSTAVGHVRACFPEACSALPDDDLRLRVARGIARGRHHGLDDREDLLRFLNVTFALGESFEDRYPWAQEILDNRAFAPVTRLDLVMQKAVAELERPRHRAEVELVLPGLLAEPDDAEPFDGLPLDDDQAALVPAFEEANFEPMTTIWAEVPPGAGDDEETVADSTGGAAEASV